MRAGGRGEKCKRLKKKEKKKKRGMHRPGTTVGCSYACRKITMMAASTSKREKRKKKHSKERHTHTHTQPSKCWGCCFWRNNSSKCSSEDFCWGKGKRRATRRMHGQTGTTAKALGGWDGMCNLTNRNITTQKLHKKTAQKQRKKRRRRRRKEKDKGRKVWWCGGRHLAYLSVCLAALGGGQARSRNNNSSNINSKLAGCVSVGRENAQLRRQASKVAQTNAV